MKTRVVAPPTIVCDTREQTPWIASVRRDGHRVLLPVVRRALVAGDYTIEGYGHEIAIERKSLQDWIGTMFSATTDALGERATSWERFRRELSRALEGVQPADGSAPTPPLQRFVVVVEGSRAQVKAHDYRSGVLPQSVLGRSDSLLVDRNIHVEWAGDREEAERYAMWVLCRWWERREMEKGASAGDIARAFKLVEAGAGAGSFCGSSGSFWRRTSRCPSGSMVDGATACGAGCNASGTSVSHPLASRWSTGGTSMSGRALDQAASAGRSGRRSEPSSAPSVGRFQSKTTQHPGAPTVDTSVPAGMRPIAEQYDAPTLGMAAGRRKRSA